MDKQNLMPNAAQPVNRITTGQLATELAELSESALSQVEPRRSSASIVSCSVHMTLTTRSRFQIKSGLLKPIKLSLPSSRSLVCPDESLGYCPHIGAFRYLAP